MKRRTWAIVILAAGVLLLAGGLWLLIRERRVEKNQGARPVEPARDNPSEAERVVALSLTYEKASAAERKAMLPEVITTLRAYRKEWQGNKARQLLFEGGYLELASRLERGLPPGGDRTLAEQVAENSALRLRYLSNDRELGRDICRARDLLRLHEYVACRNLSRTIVSGFYGRLWGVELMLGRSEDGVGDGKASARTFLDVIEETRETQPDVAGLATYLAAQGMFMRGDYENAVAMFKAMARDYPDGPRPWGELNLAEALDSLLGSGAVDAGGHARKDGA